MLFGMFTYCEKTTKLASAVHKNIKFDISHEKFALVCGGPIA